MHSLGEYQPVCFSILTFFFNFDSCCRCTLLRGMSADQAGSLSSLLNVQ